MFESHLILRLAIVQNKFQQANTPKINHINNNHIKFEVSLHFFGIWPTVCHAFGHDKYLQEYCIFIFGCFQYAQLKIKRNKYSLSKMNKT